MTAYYNEHDPIAAQWLRNLISAGHIAPGDVDERSIEDVQPDELVRYRQCHFFAGVGVWSYALRRAGWADDRPVWTMSCPCQPFSAAGEGAGFDDERHLWPAGHHLIAQRRPAIVFGEQVASKDAMPWIDLVHDDMEALGYAFGAVPFPSAGIGAPHIRDRLYWAASDGVALGHAISSGLEGFPRHGDDSHQPGRLGAHPLGSITAASGFGRLADAQCERHDWRGAAGTAGTAISRRLDAAGRPHPDAGERPGNDGWSGPTNGLWRAADWLHCRDGKWRPVEPGSSPLAYGLASSMGSLSPEQGRLAGLARLDGASLARAKRYRTGSLRGYGNAINAEQAIAFIESLM